MRTVNFTLPLPVEEQASRTARLVRHLAARLNDFGPDGPEVLEADPARGFVAVRFPGHDPESVLNQLNTQHAISAILDGDRAVFHLSPTISFEDLDYTWGCLLELLWANQK
ncbi:MAG: hypothetical protein VB071_07455 [Lawsonibacter sp.]|nr:hypothetical protein [Lawsonibacter sp.]